MLPNRPETDEKKTKNLSDWGRSLRARRHGGLLTKLGREHAGERFGSLVANEMIVDHAGAVNHAVDPTQPGVNIVDQNGGRSGIGVADV